MPSISELPDDILCSVYNWLGIRQLVIASHVCQRWRLFALEHRNFWGQATIHRGFSPSEVDFFLARISRSQVGERLVDVTIEPSRLRDAQRWSLDQLDAMLKTVIPALSATLSRIVSLTLEVPAVFSEPMFAALRQPAPALRRLKIANRPQQGSVLLPHDIFVGSAPALVEFSLGGDIQLPAHSIPGFRTVETFELLGGPRRLDLSSIFEWFPNAYRINTLGCRTKSCGLLTPQQLTRLGQLDSLGLHVSFFGAMRQSNIPWKIMLPIRQLEVQWFMQSRHWFGPVPSAVPMADAALPSVLIPQASRELHCSVLDDRMRLVFPGPSDSDLPFVRSVSGLMSYADQGRIWGGVAAYPALVTLSIDIDVLETVRDHPSELRALEALLVTLKSRLPRCKALARPVPCPCLRTVLFQSRLYSGGIAEPAIVTCRGVDEFLHASFAVGDWAALDVVLVDMVLYGAAQIDDTRIAGVRALSRQECAGLGPRVAMLLGDMNM